MAISHVNSAALAQSATGGASPWNVGSFTVAAGAHRILFVYCAFEANAGRAITAVARNGQAFTKAVERLTATGSSTRESASLWYLIEPDVGSFDVVVTYTGGTGADFAVAASQYNADNALSVTQTDSAEVQSADLPAQIAFDIADGELIYFAGVRNDHAGGTVGVAAGATLRHAGDIPGQGSTLAFLYAIGDRTGAGNHSIHITWTSAGFDPDNLIVGAVVTEAAGEIAVAPVTCLHDHAAQNAAAAQIHSIAAAGGLHAHGADALTLAQWSGIVVADAGHALSSLVATLSQSHGAMPEDALHPHVCGGTNFFSGDLTLPPARRLPARRDDVTRVGTETRLHIAER